MNINAACCAYVSFKISGSAYPGRGDAEFALYRKSDYIFCFGWKIVMFQSEIWLNKFKINSKMICRIKKF